MARGTSVFNAIQSLPQIRRNAGRFTDVVGILAKHGLASWLHKGHPEFLKNRFKTADGTRIADLSNNENIRFAITALGPAWIKLGQVMSTRPDLVGPELAEELEKLQAHTPADKPEAVRATIEAELGRKVEDCFSSFDFEPLGSASIGQVHAAQLADGRSVVVKVQHGGIEEPIRADLDIMAVLADLAETHDPGLALYQPVRVVREFSRTLLRELDYGRERGNAETFVENFEGDEGVRFPRPLPQLSARRVLTMERLDGISVGDVPKLDERGADTEALARKGADVWINMILRDGFFHADPHPGNLLALDDGTLGILDCGMVGVLDATTTEQFEDLVIALLSKDGDQLAYELLRLCKGPPDLDREAFRTDLREFVADYLRQSMEEVDFSAAALVAMEIIRRHHLILPGSLSVLIKTLVILESTSRRLHRGFNIVELLQPYRKNIIKKRLSPQALIKRFTSSARDWERLGRALPQDAMEILDRIRAGSFDVNLRHRDLDAVTNRLVYGMLSSALFVGSAVVLSSEVPPVIWGISVGGALGTIVAVILAARLLRAIRRHGNLGR